MQPAASWDRAVSAWSLPLRRGEARSIANSMPIAVSSGAVSRCQARPSPRCRSTFYEAYPRAFCRVRRIVCATFPTRAPHREDPPAGIDLADSVSADPRIEIHRPGSRRHASLPLVVKAAQGGKRHQLQGSGAEGDASLDSHNQCGSHQRDADCWHKCLGVSQRNPNEASNRQRASMMRGQPWRSVGATSAVTSWEGDDMSAGTLSGTDWKPTRLVSHVATIHVLPLGVLRSVLDLIRCKVIGCRRLCAVTMAPRTQEVQVSSIIAGAGCDAGHSLPTLVRSIHAVRSSIPVHIHPHAPCAGIASPSCNRGGTGAAIKWAEFKRPGGVCTWRCLYCTRLADHNGGMDSSRETIVIWKSVDTGMFKRSTARAGLGRCLRCERRCRCRHADIVPHVSDASGRNQYCIHRALQLDPRIIKRLHAADRSVPPGTSLSHPAAIPLGAPWRCMHKGLEARDTLHAPSPLRRRSVGPLARHAGRWASCHAGADSDAERCVHLARDVAAQGADG
jgi:hypothetical protein